MFNDIKTYGLNNKEGNQTDFVMKKIEDVYDLLNGIDDEPHRHEYYTLILVSKGSGKHVIDFNEFEITDQSIHFVYPGQVHQISTPQRPHGWVMNFSSEFLLQNAIDQTLVDRVYLYKTTGYSPPLKLSNEEYARFVDIINQVKFFSTKDIALKYEALGSLLKLFFININSLCCVQLSEDLEQAIGTNSLFMRFKKLVEYKYKSRHKVNEYAEELAVSSDYLNKYIKSQSGKSAKEFIQDKIIVEAKRRLIFTSESNKELAYYLGFEEPSHFSNFFKKITAKTPGQFRSENTIVLVK